MDDLTSTLNIGAIPKGVGIVLYLPRNPEDGRVWDIHPLRDPDGNVREFNIIGSSKPEQSIGRETFSIKRDQLIYNGYFGDGDLRTDSDYSRRRMVEILEERVVMILHPLKEAAQAAAQLDGETPAQPETAIDDHPIQTPWHGNPIPAGEVAFDPDTAIRRIEPTRSDQ